MFRGDAIVPLQVDAASGPEEVISEKALETGSSLAGRECVARPAPPSDVLDLLGFDRALPRDGDFPAAVHQQGPELRRLDEGASIPSAEALFGYDAQGYDVYTRTVYGARASVSVGILATAVHPGLRVCGRDHCRIPRRMARLGDRANCRDFLGDPDIPRWNPVPLHVPQPDRHSHSRSP